MSEHRQLPMIAGAKDDNEPRKLEDQDTLQSAAIVRILDVVCEGEIKGFANGLSSVFLNETPLVNPADGTRNFDGVKVELITGTPFQQRFRDLQGLESEIAVNVEVLQATPVIRSISNPNVDAVRVRVALPALWNRDPSDGRIAGWQVSYAFDLRSAGGPWVPQGRLGAQGSPQDFATNPISPPLTIALEGSVRWLPPGSPGSAEGPDPVTVFTRRRFNIRYRLGAAPWQTGFVFDEFGGYQGEPRTIGWAINGLTPGSYEVQLEDVAGDGAIEIIWGTVLVMSDVISVAGKASARTEFAYLIRMAGPAPWDIRMRRVSPDSATATIADKTFWAGYTEIVETKLNFPNTAAVYTEGDSRRLPSVPSRAYELDLIICRVPTNYDPIQRTYTGIWDGTFKLAWHSNPAWAFYDMCTNPRYGLGHVLGASALDKWALYEIGRYCDELVSDGRGGMEPRFALNVYIQEAREAHEVLQSLVSAFRGMVYWSSGMVLASQDAPAQPVAVYTPANILGGRATFSGSSRRQRHTVVRVAWNDPSDFYRQKIEYVEDEEGIERYGIQPTTLAMFGCTSRGQARRAGLWMLFTERFETETVSWKVALEGALRRPGQIVELHLPMRAGVRMGGRILAGNATEVTLDAPVTLAPGLTYSLGVVLDATTTESRTVTNPAGTHTVITLASPLSRAPTPYLVWVMRTSTLVPMQVRLLSVAQSDANTYEVTGLVHQPGKFALIEQGIKLDPLPISNLRAKPLALTGLDHGEYLEYAQDGSLSSTVWFQTDAQIDVGYYRIEWRRGLDNWTAIESQTPRLEISRALVGAVYYARMQAVSRVGVVGPKVQITHLCEGKLDPPSDATDFTASVLASGLRRYAWAVTDELDLDGYEIRYHASSVDFDAMTPLVQGLITEVPFETALPPAGTYNLALKKVDRSGIRSQNAAIIVGAVLGADVATFAGSVTKNLVKDSLFYLPMAGANKPWRIWGVGAGRTATLADSPSTKRLTGEPGGVVLTLTANTGVPGTAYVGPSRLTQSYTPAGMWPVQAGRVYEYSVYAGNADGPVSAVINWHDASGAFLSSSTGAAQSAAAGLVGGETLAQFGRPFVIATAPTGAALAFPYITLGDVIAPAAEARAWLIRDQWGESRAGQVEPSPWAPAGILTLDGGLIDPGSVRTVQLEDEAATAVRVATTNGFVLPSATPNSEFLITRARSSGAVSQQDMGQCAQIVYTAPLAGEVLMTWSGECQGNGGVANSVGLLNAVDVAIGIEPFNPTQLAQYTGRVHEPPDNTFFLRQFSISRRRAVTQGEVLTVRALVTDWGFPVSAVTYKGELRVEMIKR
jgi:predicted phage tail protein